MIINILIVIVALAFSYFIIWEIYLGFLPEFFDDLLEEYGEVPNKFKWLGAVALSIGSGMLFYGVFSWL